MDKRILNTALAASLTFLGFFGLDGSTQEYGALSGALRRTVAQALPPYHPTQDTAQEQRDSGVATGVTAPAAANPSSASETTPKVQ